MNESGAYEEFLTLLVGPVDFWDRPAGDWPVHSIDDIRREVREARQDANAAYRLGTKALHRGDLDGAEAWFAVACDQRHPGAAFRAALTRLLAMVPSKMILSDQVGSGKTVAGVALMATQMGSHKSHTPPVAAGSDKGRVIVLLAAAASWGHGDAQHLISRLRSGAGEGVADLGQPAAELNARMGEGDLARMVLMADTGPYEPQDTEYYPTTQALLEQCFADHRDAPQPPTLRGAAEGVTEHQVLAPTHQLLDAGSERELSTSGELFGAESWSPRRRLLAGDSQGSDRSRWLGSRERPLAHGLADNAGVLILPDVPLLIWPRSCGEEASTPGVDSASQRHCLRCNNELTPDAWIEALGANQQSPWPFPPQLAKTLRCVRKAQETLQHSESVELGSRLAILFDDPREVFTEAPLPVRAEHPRSSPGQVRGFTHRVLRDYLYGSMDSPSSARVEGLAAQHARWSQLPEGVRDQWAEERTLTLITAMCEGIDRMHAEQVAASMLVSIKGLSTGFDLPRPSSLHVVCDKTERLYFFTDPHDVVDDPEEPRLAVPMVITSPPENSEETAQPITTTHSPSSDRSEPSELSRADPLQVYALG